MKRNEQCLEEGAFVVDSEKETGKRKRKKNKKKGVGRIILMILGFLLLFAVTIVLTIGFLTIRPPDISNKDKDTNDPDTKIEERADGRYSVLIVGTDEVGLNTDTILVASLDSKNNVASILSVPRDTMSNVTRNVKKINAAYASGAKNGVGNIDNLKKEISYLIGFSVDNYVIINLDAFEELIDALGGVTIDVPRNMDYDDPYQDLHIHIEKGMQTLNGKDAIGFVRYRKGYAEGDLGRVKAQQLFMQALAEQVATPATVTKLPQLAEIVLDNMRTDLTYGELAWFVKEAVSIDVSNDLHMFTLPGIAATVKPDGSYQALSYYLPYEDEILEMVNTYFNPYATEITKLNLVDTAALLKKAGTQKVERENQGQESDLSNDSEENPLDEMLSNETGDVTNLSGDDSESKNDEEGTNGDKTIESDPSDTSGNQNTDTEKEPADPNTQAPDEVLKNEADQNNGERDTNVTEPSDTTTNTENAEPSGTNSDEEHDVQGDTVQAGGIPGEVLKSDAE